MKKTIFYFLILLLSGCIFIKDQVLNLEFGYIKTIPKEAQNFIKDVGDTLILTKEEIKQYNKEIAKKTDSLYDVLNMESLTKEEIKKYIDSYTLPFLPKYDSNKVLTALNTKTIIENRNIENVETQTDLLKGIIVKRSDLRAFPTEVSFYDKKGIQDFDRIQETELAINTPVRILHESKDQLWNFVVSPIYAGWVLKENIALAKEEDWDFFIHNPAFGVITDANLKVEGDILDMGVRLPVTNFLEDQYQLAVPIKTEENTVSKKIIHLSKDKAHIGYLPYTSNNVILQAFKYENIPYSWGGKEEGVDCSSFVRNVYKTFGFIFPRNTAEQKNSVGEILLLTNKSLKEKQKLISENGVSLLYEPGHVMMYLGQKNGKNYVMHASGKEKKVTLMELNSSHLSKIDRIVKVP